MKDIDWSAVLNVVLTFIVIPFLIWNARTLQRVSDAVFGVDGSNGLRGRVTEIETKQAEHGQDIAVLKERTAA